MANPIVLARATRFLATSGISALTGQALLFAFFNGLDLSAIVANIIAFSIGALVGFKLAVRFVWVSEGDNRSEFLPFITLSALGLVLSTLLAHVVSEAWAHALAANVGSVTGFGVVWVLRFVVLDTVIFRPARSARE